MQFKMIFKSASRPAAKPKRISKKQKGKIHVFIASLVFLPQKNAHFAQQDFPQMMNSSNTTHPSMEKTLIVAVYIDGLSRSLIISIVA